ncbi:sensor histidine kinase [Amphibiibacter pelophylacis]|uniref:Sensor histidine kinase n=1 Tax=Amphibiibacter pelophylacis TaxID=1799477 RepID=A0ACC6P050_9BURK
MRHLLQRLWPGRGSLRLQLLLWLVLPQLVLWSVAAVFTYQLATRYANAATDAGLIQSARALARQVKPSGSGFLVDFPRAAQDILEADPGDRLYYMVSSPPGSFLLGNDRLPPPPAVLPLAPGHPLLYSGSLAVREGRQAHPVRVVALLLRSQDGGSAPQSLLVQVARRSAGRQAMASQILLDTALPLSGVMLLMTLGVGWGIRRGLRPLDRLQAALARRHPGDMRPLDIREAPHEVQGLVQAVNDLLDQVQRQVQHQKRFISDAAHQLRTPLAGLKSQTELAWAHASDPPLKARLERVMQSARRSAHLVTQLLSLARADPTQPLELTERVTASALMADITAQWVPRAMALGVDLGFDEAASPPDAEVWSQRWLLGEAVANLIDNALQYAGPGSTVTTRVSPGEDPGWLLLQVEDDGPGIPPDQHGAVLQRFTRLQDGGEGCGLGLPIASEIAGQHGGGLHLRSLVPRGLSVALRLPRIGAGQTPPV